MHHALITVFRVAAILFLAFAAQMVTGGEIAPNQLIDYPRYLADVVTVEKVRETRRLTEGDFLDAMSSKNVVVLDSRSAKKFRMRHLKGAVNLSLPDFTAAELANIIATKNTKILIYCNNNFFGSPVSFPTKAAGASLNLSTFVTLTTYGYTNVYELGPLIDIKNSVLTFEGSEVAAP